MRKNLCVLWELDQASIARCEELSRAFVGSPFLCTNFHPHITLGCYENVNSKSLNIYVRGFAQRTNTFTVQFNELGLLNPHKPVCLPDLHGKLKQLYGRFHKHFDAYADKWTAKAVGIYRPHVSLAYRSSIMDPAAPIRLMDAFSPFEAQIQAMSLSWIKGENDYEIIATYPLRACSKNI